MTTSETSGVAHQDLELEILVGCVDRLGSRVAVDVGAETGTFVAALREGGYEEIFAFEPHPANVDTLRERFDTDVRTTVFATAVGDVEGTASLRLAQRDDGEALPYYHTLEPIPNARDVSWRGTLEVPVTTLGALVSDGSVPGHVGVLKVDTEGHDLRVLQGIGALAPELVVVEHWLDLPDSLGPCPWTIGDLRAVMEPRGFSEFVFVTHAEIGSWVQWNAVEIVPGDWGNIIFVHDSVLDKVRPVLVAVTATAQRHIVERLRETQDAADARLIALEEATAELEVQRTAAQERLAALEETARELEVQRVAAQERLAALETAHGDLQRLRATRSG